MHIRFVIVAGTLVFAAASSFADDLAREDTVVTSRTRAQVRAEVLEARARGQLATAGEAGLPLPEAAGSSATRAGVEEELRLARERGELSAAGEADPAGERQFASSSDRSRAEVKAEVLAARKAGELIPAGEAYDGSRLAQARAEPGRGVFSRFARLMRK